MTFTSNNMPPLDATDAPWTDAEMHIRETMLASEAHAPEGLESQVFEALDASTSAPQISSLVRRGALLVASGVAVAAFFWPAEDVVVNAGSTQEAPVMAIEAPVTTAGQSAEAPAMQVLDEEVADAPQAEDVLTEAEVDGTGNVNAPMEPLENLEGLPTTELEGGNDRERFPLKSEKAVPATERREATLEVKQ